jgi:cyanophycin synthetase
LEITRIRMLRGPNLWSRHTALEAIVNCEVAERSIDAIPQFETKIRERFPQLGSMRRGGHTEALSLSLAHALEHAALGLASPSRLPSNI